MSEAFEHYLRRRIDPEASLEALQEFPRYFEIETVNACNARCPMCTIDDWTRQTPIMKDGLYEKLVDEIAEHKDVVKRVSLFRDGEPLLDKKMPRRIAMLKERGIREVAFSTNVSLLNEKMASDILHAGLDTITMSIDSLKKEVFEAIRVRLNFEEVMENTLRFIELRDRIRPETKVWVRMVRQESNVDEWPEYERFWKGKLGPNDRVNYHNLHNWGDQLKGFKPIADSYEPNLPCIVLWSLMVIFGDGRVPLCNVDYNNKFPTGDVSENSIAEVWQSKVMNERRRLHLDGAKATISICDNCNVWDEPSDKEHVASEYAEEVAIAAAG